MSDKTFTITVDGKKIEARPGETILEAALRSGIQIPTFCWHPKLDPVGACRICLVKVEKSPKLVVSCATPAVAGQVVSTNSPEVIKGRQGVLEFLLINHPLDCPTCDKGGECDLQDLTFRYGVDLSRYLEHKFRWAEQNTFDEISLGPMVLRNQNRCIHCYKCTRVIQEVCGEHDLGAYQRGYRTEIHHWPAKAFEDQYAGNAVEVCPVGALTAKDFRYKVRVWLTKQTKSVCQHCSDGCNTLLWVDPERNFLSRVTSRRNDCVDEGFLCSRGKFQYQEANSPERLKTPLIRKDGRLVEVTWDEAYATLAKRLKDLKAKNGGESLAGIASATTPNEDLYLFSRFLRTLVGSNNLDFRVNWGTNLPDPDLFYKFNRFSVAGVEQKKMIFVFGCDFNREHPIITLRIRKASRKFGARVVLANPYRTKLGDSADVEAVYRFGSEVTFVNSLCQEIIRQKLYPKEGYFCGEAIPEDFIQHLTGFPADQTAKVTGVDSEQVERLARALAGQANMAILCGNGVLQHPQRNELVAALVNLAALLIGPSKVAQSLWLLPEEANFQGALDTGFLPDQLPGNQPLADSQARAKCEQAWKKSISQSAGLSISQIIEATKSGKIKTWWVIGGEPTWQYPDHAAVEEAVKKVECLIVQANFRTPVVERADIVLPSAMLFERDGSFTSAEKRVQRFRAGMKPVGQAKADWQIFSELAWWLEEPFDLFSAEEVFDEMAKLVPQYAGLNCKLLGDQGLRWAEVNPEKEWTHKFTKVSADPIVAPPGDYPFLLLSGNSLYQSGFVYARTENLLRQEPHPTVELSSETLASFACEEGDWVEIASPSGKVRVTAKENPYLSADVGIFHDNYPEARFNFLTDESRDFCRVKLSKAPQPVTAQVPEPALAGVR